MKKYEDAAAAFEFTATRYEKHENSEAAYFYWGRTRYAQALAAENAEKRMAHFTTAILAFGKQLELFEKGALSDQALYLRGESFYNQDDKTKAIADYRAVVIGFPKSSYRQDAIYVLGATLEEKEKYKEAGVAYDLFLKEFPESGLRTEVRMRKAESMLQDNKFEEAAQIFAEVAAVEGFDHATRSRLRQAFVSSTSSNWMMLLRSISPYSRQPKRQITRRLPLPSCMCFAESTSKRSCTTSHWRWLSKWPKKLTRKI